MMWTDSTTVTGLRTEMLYQGRVAARASALMHGSVVSSRYLVRDCHSTSVHRGSTNPSNF